MRWTWELLRDDGTWEPVRLGTYGDPHDYRSKENALRVLQWLPWALRERLRVVGTPK